MRDEDKEKEREREKKEKTHKYENYMLLIDNKTVSKNNGKNLKFILLGNGAHAPV